MNTTIDNRGGGGIGKRAYSSIVTRVDVTDIACHGTPPLQVSLVQSLMALYSLIYDSNLSVVLSRR